MGSCEAAEGGEWVDVGGQGMERTTLLVVGPDDTYQCFTKRVDRGRSSSRDTALATSLLLSVQALWTFWLKKGTAMLRIGFLMGMHT